MLLLGIITFAQTKVAFAKLAKQEDGNYYYEGKAYTGESLMLWPSNNKPMQRITWTNGEIDGLFSSWYKMVNKIKK